MGVAQITAGPITVVAGKTYRVAINAPPRGNIIQAQCVQPSGTNTTFSFTFYNSAKSCPPDPLDGSGFPVPPATSPVDAMTEYAGQIGPTRTVATAKDRWLGPDGNDGGWIPVGMYSNADAGHSDAKSKLYMKFVAGGPGTYYVFLTIQTTRD